MTNEDTSILIGVINFTAYNDSQAKIIHELAELVNTKTYLLSSKESYIEMLQKQLDNAHIPYEKFDAAKHEYTAPTAAAEETIDTAKETTDTAKDTAQPKEPKEVNQ